MMNMQQAFDAMLTHARTQGTPAFTNARNVKSARCMYHLPQDNGPTLKCLFGALIPDAQYNPQCENRLATDLIKSHDPMVDGLFDESIDRNTLTSFVQDCQNAHDNPCLSRSLTGAVWLEACEKNLKRVAEQYGLTYTSPVL